MKFTKPSPGLVAEFHAATADIRGAQPRKMFGYDCIFVGGHFAAGLWKNTCVFKLSDEEGARLVATTGAIPFAPMGHVMRSWYEAPEAVAHDAEQLAAWCATAAAFARGQPPKVKGKPRPAAGRPPGRPAPKQKAPSLGAASRKALKRAAPATRGSRGR